jgi:hypothetical protein
VLPALGPPAEALHVVRHAGSRRKVVPMATAPTRSHLRRLVATALAGGSVAGLVTWAFFWAGSAAQIAVAAAVLGAMSGAALYLSAVTWRAVGRTHAKLDQVRGRLHDVPTSGQVASLVGDARNHLHGDISEVLGTVRDDTRQLEALLNLHAVIPVRAPLPASRGWAASPDLLLAYVGEILSRRPGLIVECGSGLSTLWAALALQATGGNGRVVALEHDAEYCEATRATLAAHGVGHLAEVRHAPIEPVTLGDKQQPWYTLSAVGDLDKIDLLFVDGPIGSMDPEARYPAVPLLRDRLTPGTAIILDDADRPEEKNVVTHWCADWPELSCEMLRLEKGAARLRVPR